MTKATARDAAFFPTRWRAASTYDGVSHTATAQSSVEVVVRHVSSATAMFAVGIGDDVSLRIDTVTSFSLRIAAGGSGQRNGSKQSERDFARSAHEVEWYE